MKKRITQEDINFSRMFCFESSKAPEQPQAQGEEAPEQPETQDHISPEQSERKGSTKNPWENFNVDEINRAVQDFVGNKKNNDSTLIHTGESGAVKLSNTGLGSSGSGIVETGLSRDDGSETPTFTSSHKIPKVKYYKEDLGNGMFRYKVLVNGKEMSADDALEKKLIDQKQYDEIKKHNSIIDRSQETASNRMRDMWIRKGEKMSDWWKRLDDEQKMGLIGGGFLGGGLLLSNMNKKKRGLGDYISHYGIPAAIAGLSVYGGSAWNADENTYNLGRYNYLMDQAQQQQQNNTATA